MTFIVDKGYRSMYVHFTNDFGENSSIYVGCHQAVGTGRCVYGNPGMSAHIGIQLYASYRVNQAVGPAEPVGLIAEGRFDVFLVRLSPPVTFLRAPPGYLTTEALACPSLPFIFAQTLGLSRLVAFAGIASHRTNHKAP